MWSLLDPKVMEELHLSTGDVIEISSKAAKKKTSALLWSSQPRKQLPLLLPLTILII
jgi:hypothetical protein